MAAFRHPGTLSPALAGVLGSFLTMWSTFVPPFIWIFLGGPYVETLLGNKALNAALSAITAAVVGAPALALPVPVVASINWAALALALIAIVAIFRFKIGMLATFAACSALG